jgi:hypothetical protein
MGDLVEIDGGQVDFVVQLLAGDLRCQMPLLLLLDGSTDRELPHRGVPYFRAASCRPGNFVRTGGGSLVEGVQEFSDAG